MNSRFKKSIVVSILTHVALLAFLNMSPQPKNTINNIEITLAFDDQSKLALASSEKKNNLNKNKSKKNISPTPIANYPQSDFQEKNIKNKPKDLIRNNFPPSTRKIKKFFKNKSKQNSSTLTLNKSEDTIKDSFPLDGKTDNQKKLYEETDSLFDGTKVFNNGKQKNKDKKNIGGNAATGDFDNRKNLISGNQKGGRNSEENSASNGENIFKWKSKGKRTLASKEEFIFPKNLKSKGVQTASLISFDVDSSGRVFNVKLLKSSKYTELDNAIKRYIRSFRFNATKKNKIDHAEYSVTFQL